MDNEKNGKEKKEKDQSLARNVIIITETTGY